MTTLCKLVARRSRCRWRRGVIFLASVGFIIEGRGGGGGGVGRDNLGYCKGVGAGGEGGRGCVGGQAGRGDIQRDPGMVASLDYKVIFK